MLLKTSWELSCEAKRQRVEKSWTKVGGFLTWSMNQRHMFSGQVSRWVH